MLQGPFLLIFTIFLGFDLTSALYCYQCQLKDGVGDEGCDENPPNEKYLRECAQPQCWMRYSYDRTMHIERFCVAMADNANGCMPAMVEDNHGREHSGMECKCSDMDGCNGHFPHGQHRHHSSRRWRQNYYYT